MAITRLEDFPEWLDYVRSFGEPFGEAEAIALRLLRRVEAEGSAEDVCQVLSDLLTFYCHHSHIEKALATASRVAECGRSTLAAVCLLRIPGAAAAAIPIARRGVEEHQIGITSLRRCAKIRDAWTTRFAALASLEPRSKKLSEALKKLINGFGGISYINELDNAVVRTDPIRLQGQQGLWSLRAAWSFRLSQQREGRDVAMSDLERRIAEHLRYNDSSGAMLGRTPSRWPEGKMALAALNGDDASARDLLRLTEERLPQILRREASSCKLSAAGSARAVLWSILSEVEPDAQVIPALIDGVALIFSTIQLSTAVFLPAIERTLAAGQVGDTSLQWALKRLWCDLSWEHRWMGRDVTRELTRVDHLLRMVEKRIAIAYAP